MPYFNIVAETSENTVVTEYEPVKKRSDSYQSEAELEQEFKTSVDLYLQSCVEDGKEPDTPFKGVFNVRLDPELHRRVAEMAMEEDLSLNAFVNKALEKEVSNHRAGA